MLKKFFMNTLSSFMGAWIALVLFGVVAVIVVIGVMAKIGASSSTPSVKSHSVLRLELKGIVDETEAPARIDYMDLLNGNLDRPQALGTIVKGIQEGAANKDIDALYISCQGATASPATFNAIRLAVKEFKKSGKKVYAYGDSYTMGDYLVASEADSIYMNPGGELSLKGISGIVLYLKGLFDRLGVQFQVAKVGTFKSAVEPYIMDEMSEPARAQLDTLYGSMWRYIRTVVSENRRGITPERIDTLISREFLAWQPAASVRKEGFVDRCVYGRQINDILGNILGRDPENINYISPADLVSRSEWGTAYDSSRQIAVLYATGDIVDGASDGINFENLVPVITKLADEDDVKGLVLRVNSPGGSAYGSEQIGEALDYFKSKGKPLAVSMGDYAASGGYWISAGADFIYADALTITGSIGIFGLVPNFYGLSQKLGVNPQSVSTNPQASFPTGFYPMDPAQLNALQRYVERGYDKFVARVAKGRKMPESKVRRIAEGRVWDATAAVRIGLVDKIGTLQDAVTWTAKKAGIDGNYEVAIYPRLEPSVWDYLPQTGELAAMRLIKESLGTQVDPEMVQTVLEVLRRKPVQARMIPMKVSF